MPIKKALKYSPRYTQAQQPHNMMEGIRLKSSTRRSTERRKQKEKTATKENRNLQKINKKKQQKMQLWIQLSRFIENYRFTENIQQLGIFQKPHLEEEEQGRVL